MKKRLTLMTQMLRAKFTIVVSLAIKEGPILYDLFMAAVKTMLDGLFALGMSKYAPFMAFHVIMVQQLYAGNKKMQDHLKNFFTVRSAKGHLRGGPHKGGDECMEELVRELKSLISSNTNRGYEIANALARQGCVQAMRSNLDKTLGLNARASDQRDPTDLEFYIAKITDVLNLAGPGRRRESTDPEYDKLYSLNGAQVLNRSNGADVVFREGHIRLMSWFDEVFRKPYREGRPPATGKKPVIKKSFLNDKDSAINIATIVARDSDIHIDIMPEDVNEDV